MSELIAISFNEPKKADEVLDALLELQKKYLVDLEDAAIVFRKPNGKVKIKQSHNLVGAGAVGGGFWGLLLGALFLNPLAGVLIGSAAGAASGALSDVGIKDDFIKKIGENIIQNGSALFILVRRATPDKVLEELSKYEGKILHTSLTVEGEELLQRALNPEIAKDTVVAVSDLGAS